MSEQIFDCHHEDITEIVRARRLLRMIQKYYNWRRYARQYVRRGGG